MASESKRINDRERERDRERDSKAYAEINSLRLQLKELQVKYDNQQRLLGTGGAVPAASSSSSGSTAALTAEQRAEQALQRQGVETHTASNQQLAAAASAAASSLSSSSSGASSAASGSAADSLALHQSNHALQSAVASLQAALAAANEDADRARADKESIARQLGQKEELIAALQSDLSAARSDGVALRSERGDSALLLDKLSATVSEYESRIAADETRMVSLESEHQSHRALAAEKAELESLVDKLRALLLHSAADASKRNQELLNALQASKQFIEELKREYEAYASASRAEFEAYRRAKGAELTTLSERYDALRLSQFEQARDAHAEQVEVLESLQSNFLEYRLMVEQLFASEASALEGRLADQQKAHEAEMKLVVHSHAQAFTDMVTRKDAKIMGLLEGTEQAALLLGHQLELESLRRDTERALDQAREQAVMDTKRATNALRKEVLDKAAEIDTYHSAILGWESKLSHTLLLLKKQKKLHALKEEQWEAQMKSLGAQLSAAHASMESLTQAKESLRHRLLKLRLQLSGSQDESVPAVIKRLSKEAKRLAHELQSVVFAHKQKADAHKRAEAELAAQTRARQGLEQELEKRSADFAKLTKTLEGFLNLRLRTGIAGVRPGAGAGGADGAPAAPSSLYDPAIAKTLRDLSAPIMQALFEHKADFGFAEGEQTMLRATDAGRKASTSASGTMVGLRLGADAHQAAHRNDDEDDEDNDQSTAPYSQSLSRASQSHTVFRRKSILFNDAASTAPDGDSGGAAGGAGGGAGSDSAPLSAFASKATSRRSTTGLPPNASNAIADAAADANDEESATGPATDDAAAATLLSVELPAASSLSLRASPSLGHPPPPHTQHTRHISFNPALAIPGLVVASAGSAAPVVGSGARRPMSHLSSSSHLSASGSAVSLISGEAAQSAAATADSMSGHASGRASSIAAPSSRASSAASSAAASTAGSTAGSVSGGSTAAAGSYSARQSRLAELIKAEGGGPLAATALGVRRAAAPKSLRAQAQREEAARRAELHAAGIDPDAATTDAYSSDGGGVGGQFAHSSSESSSTRGAVRRDRPRYVRPAKLSALESSASLVDVTLLRQLEKGFEALANFKALSKQFAQDARGRKQVDSKAAAHAAAGDEGRGVGAFARSGGLQQQQHAWQDSQQSQQQQSTTDLSSAARRPSSSASVPVDVAALRLYGSSSRAGGVVGSGAPSHAPSLPASALGSPGFVSPIQAYQSQSRMQQHVDMEHAGSGGAITRATPLPPPATAAAATTTSSGDSAAAAEAEHMRAAAEEEEEAKRSHILSLDLRAHADPTAQLHDLSVVSHGGEETRLYTGSSSAHGGGGHGASVLPWWSSASSAIQPVASVSHSASVWMAGGGSAFSAVDKRELNGSVSQPDSGRYRPKPPAGTKRG